MRSTRQRRAIYEAIVNAHRPVSPREVLDIASKDAKGLGMATVYRTLKRLVESNEIRTVNIPGQSPFYEARDDHHHHFMCKGCGKAFDLVRDGCCMHFEEMVPRGFRIEGHELTLFGRCKACAKAG